MNLKTKLILVITLFYSVITLAQESFSVKGKVVSTADNLPILGVNIIIKNTTAGTTTDFDGNYELKVKKGDILQFSYIGFVTKSITIADQKNLNVSLEEDASKLEEVVVIGYGTQKKSHLTGSISKVLNEDLGQIAVSRVDDALVGQVSGVNIQATEGEAGSDPTIRIRGTGSITGNSGPLVVVDGVVVPNDYLGSLDMNDVESFEILKDAASGAIYGSRGGNGIIQITTKSGKSGETRFSYSTLTGVKTARQSDAYYSTVAATAAAELQFTHGLSDRTKYKQLIGVDTNWQDIIFDGGIITNHSLGIRGGNDKLRFSTNLNYNHDEGVLLTDDFKKYSVKLRLDYDVTDNLTVGLSATPSYTERRRFDGSTHDILRQPSWLPVYHDENTIQFVNRVQDGGKWADVQVGDYALQYHFDGYDLDAGAPVNADSGGTNISNTSNTNPAAKVLERDRRDYRSKILGSFYAKYKINDDLSFKTTLSGDYQRYRQQRWQGVESNRNGASAAQLDSTNTRTQHLALDNVLSYNKTFDKHDFGVVLGASGEKYKTEFETISSQGYTDDSSRYINQDDITNEYEEEYESTLLSFFTRVNYAYADKYLASFSFRRDGASVFGPNNKYGNFFAGSLGWNISRENFLKNSDVINNLKFRVSYGVTGNNSFRTGNNLINNYPYLSLIDNSIASGVTGGAVTNAANPLNISNPDLKWERQVEFNPGVDFGFFNNVLSGSVDYYKRTSDQLLLNNPIASTTGFTNALVNIGEVENSGIEVELRTRNVAGPKFKWTTTFITSTNKNELTDFADSNGQIQNVDSKRAAEWINLEGNPISSFYGWVVERDIPLEFLKNPFHPVGAEAQDVYVKDLNGDGIIDDDDKTILGNPYPEFVWSMSNDFKIGNFDFSFMFQGSHGAEIRNMGDQYIFNHFNSSQDFVTGPTGDYILGTPNQEFIKQKIFTNDIIQDASYIALRNINLGYNFSKDVTSQLKIRSARIYLSAQNVMYLTADNYTGFNPESINTTSATTYGYQRAGSPVFSTLSAGINIEF
ncbi:TonB-linked SusC/RagA family outer membrane protein [Cellulophaga sp. RHA19]|uniref:SusC/RagA family TonB-linked outer membrane protein n=1 Tax=Cellulophaga sp. RHA19 TaxID=1798237 RepID=UPI000C2CA7DE|nr:TonB-dependent receptor [Cellulophaga sp. RHA19]PKB43684.1 TonB-linked SusC/RagA family outer membrane protein [Cellulophaga sp. RHA19]